MVTNRFYSISVIFIVLVFGYLTYQVLKPFLLPIAWAIVISLVFYPLYRYLLRYIKNRPVTSILTLLIILCVMFGPLTYLTYLVTQELNSLVNYLKQEQLDTFDKIMHYPAINKIANRILSSFDMTEAEFNKTITANLSVLGKEILTRITSSVGNIVSSVLDVIFIFLTVFFLLEDGPKFLERVSDFMPFSKRQKERLIKQVKDIIISTIYGGVTVALAQGIIGGIAFSILGIPSAVLWGLSMFFASFIPLVGTFIIWGPATVYLFLKGFYLKGVILILIGIFAISMVDNILRPLIVGGKTKMPTLLIFFSILGGIKLFGFIGFIMGPLVLALFVSVFEIFRYTEEKEDESIQRSGE